MPALMRYPMAIEGGSEAVSIMDDLDQDRRKKAQAVFEANRGHSPRVRWVEQAGGAPWSFVNRSFYADLLVMGCYGHSRTREFVMGGMTRSILQSMTLPVPMVH